MWSTDTAGAEGRYGRELALELTPERIFDRSWALTLLGRVLGYGTVTAGDLEIACVPRPREVSALVQRLAG